jgi:hypothetical protein
MKFRRVNCFLGFKSILDGDAAVVLKIERILSRMVKTVTGRLA